MKEYRIIIDVVSRNGQETPAQVQALLARLNAWAEKTADATSLQFVAVQDWKIEAK